LPAVAGNEGVGVVKSIGSNVKSLKVGDWVVPAASGFGTWREDAVANETEFVKVPNDIPMPYAATIAVNPGTAYRMLRDFVQLKPGDYIIQNGANSMVGMAVVQMAREMGVRTINIIRSSRPDFEIQLSLLTNLGGDINIPDNYVNTEQFRELIKDIPPIKLGLNCIGGESATQMARVLGTGATLVTYGGMSKQPFTVPYELLTYKQLNLQGFWISKWNETHSQDERRQMLNDIASMVRDDKLKLFYELHDFDDFNYALKQSLLPYRLRKVVLNMDFPDRFKEHDEMGEKEPRVYDKFDTSVV